MRWHPKPPVNGRELTAEDVRYTVERFLTVKGNPSAYMLRPVERVEAVDRYTVKFTLKEPFAWFLDMLASPMFTAIVARECVEAFGDLKKAESVVGTGPWMLDSYRPNRGLTFVRHPAYFMPGLPHIDRIEAVVDEDNASRMAAFLAGSTTSAGSSPAPSGAPTTSSSRTRCASGGPASAPRSSPQRGAARVDADRPTALQRRARAPGAVARHRPPGRDRRAFEGVGVLNPAVPAAFKEWSLPVAQLGEGARYFRHDVAEARRLLASAGYANGFPAALCFATYGSHDLTDAAQLLVKRLKDVGVDAARPARVRRVHRHVLPRQVRLPGVRAADALHRPAQLRVRHALPGGAEEPEPRQRPRAHRSSRAPAPHVRRWQAARPAPRPAATPRPAAVLPPAPLRRDIAAWDDALKNYGPNLGYDYGGRLVAAWLDR